MKKLFLLLLILVSCQVSASTLDSDAAAKGYEIAREFDIRESGFDNFTADLEMQLYDQRGRKSVRQLRALTLETNEEGESERRILIFDTPQDVQGTVMLTASNEKTADDQWIYFPAHKRTKRISSANRAGSFMGSEFSYEDLGSPALEKYSYKFLRDQQCRGEICFVFERYPVEGESGYRKQVLWVDQTHYRLRRVEYYDRKDELLKILTIPEYKEYVGKFWKADSMEMHNVQNGKKTVLVWSNYEFKKKLDKTMFRQSSIDRLR